MGIIYYLNANTFIKGGVTTKNAIHIIRRTKSLMPAISCLFYALAKLIYYNVTNTNTRTDIAVVLGSLYKDRANEAIASHERRNKITTINEVYYARWPPLYAANFESTLTTSFLTNSVLRGYFGDTLVFSTTDSRYERTIFAAFVMPSFTYAVPKSQNSYFSTNLPRSAYLLNKNGSLLNFYTSDNFVCLL